MKYDQIIDKKKELSEIINNSNNVNEEDKYDKGLRKGISESFQLFESVISFYNQYKGNVNLLMKEQNKLWLKWVNYYNHQTGINNSNYTNRYNKWLFDNLFIILNFEEKSELFKLF